MTESVRLLLTTGNGPDECRFALSRIAEILCQEAETEGVDADIALSDNANRHGPASAMVTLHGPAARAIASRWQGSIVWIAPSPFRPHHKRRNWFLAILPMPDRTTTETSLSLSNLRFETFRAGGAGGQHQNTTDSAVRAVHIPTGLAVVVRDQRSQHQNRKAAIDRIAALLSAQAEMAMKQNITAWHQQHKQLERGNPTRSFKGMDFVKD